MLLAGAGGVLRSLGLGQALPGRFVQVVHAPLEFDNPGVERLAAQVEAFGRFGRQERQGPPRERRACEHGLHAVVVPGRNRVELVVVAAGAAQRQAEKRLPDVMRHVIEEQLSGHPRHSHASVLPGTCAEKARRDDRVGILGEEFVPGNLFQHELVVRLVPVEAADHVVPIAPRVRQFEVVRVPRRVGVARDVEPVAAPPFAVPGRLQQALDEHLVGAVGIVGQERVDFLGRRRQTGQVKREASNQRAPVRPRRRLNAVLRELGKDEVVDGRADRVQIHSVPWGGDPADWTKCPQIGLIEVPFHGRAAGRIRRSFRDPVAKRPANGLGQPVLFPARGHLQFADVIDRLHQQARAGVAGYDRRPSLAALEGRTTGAEVELAKGVALTMTPKTFLLECRLDGVQEEFLSARRRRRHAGQSEYGDGCTQEPRHG